MKEISSSDRAKLKGTPFIQGANSLSQRRGITAPSPHFPHPQACPRL